MVDTVMALWNRGYGSRGILVSLAFLLVCISISLLLITVAGPWTGGAGYVHTEPPHTQQGSIVNGGSTVTATTSVSPTVQGTTPVSTPTATPFAHTCTITPSSSAHASVHVSPVVHQGVGSIGNTGSRGTTYGGSSHQPVPPSVPRPHPTPVKPAPSPGTTPVAGVTPTVAPTQVPTTVPTPEATPTMAPTSVDTPVAAVTPVDTPPASTATTPTAVVTATATLPSQNRGQRGISTSSDGGGGISDGQNPQQGTTGTGNCMRANTGYSIGLVSPTEISSLLMRNLWLILGGSTLGTLLFYLLLYTLNRTRSR